MDTLQDTFNKYFADEPDSETCVDCGGSDNLSVLYIGLSRTVRICKPCDDRRRQASKELADAESAQIAEWAARDEWEEAT